MWPFEKKSSDHALRELVESLTKALGNRLVSVLLFGSKASGEFRENRSSVNVFVVMTAVSEETLDRIAGPMGAWTKAGHPMPVFVADNELQAYANNLPIEFLDMQDHRQVLYGKDVLQGLTVNRNHLRAQCAQELSLKLLKLRQAFVLVHADAKRLRELLLDSLPSILTLFRAALRLETDVPKGNKIAAAKELAGRAGFDGNLLERLWELHMRRDRDNMADLAWQYLEGVERVLIYVSKV